MTSLFAGIYTLFVADETLSGLLTGGLHKSKGKEGASYPYAVMSIPSMVPNNTLDDTYRRFVVQFNIYSDSATSDQAAAIFEALNTVYDECTPEVEGWTCKMFRFRLGIPLSIAGEGLFQYTAQYDVLIRKN